MRLCGALLFPLALCGCPEGAAGDNGDSGDGVQLGGEDGGEGEPAGEGEGEGEAGNDVVVAHTSLADGALALSSDVPPRVSDCSGRCADVDGDGLVDAWEDAAIDRLRPLLRLDESESLVDDPGAVVGIVARVTAATLEPLDVRVHLMVGYDRDYGSCGFTGHNGDSEHVALKLALRDPGPSGPGAENPGGQVGGGVNEVVVVAAFTTGHEGTSNDQSVVWQGASLADLQFVLEGAEPRWVVFPSADKHATYGTLGQCEAVSRVPCFDEDCGPDDVDDAARFDVLPPFVNAGEPDLPLVTDLGAIGFPGDDAWRDQDFCGGHARDSGCTAAVVDKLTADPFGP